MKVSEEDKVFILKPFQGRFVLSQKRHPAFVGGWATGKSLCGILRGMNMSEEYPHNLGVIFRREFTDLRDSTIKDFEKYTKLVVNSSRDTQLENGSIIMFRHIEELNNLQNINLGWFWIEQAEEMDTDEEFFILWGRLRRADVGFRTGFITSNTKGHNWIYKLWKLGQLEGGKLIEATTEMNADVLPVDYLDSLKVLEKKKPSLYRRFVLNSWEESDVSDVIIQPSWVENAAKRDLLIRHPIRKIVSIDVARSNPGEGDKTVFYAIENNKAMGKGEYETRNTMEVVGKAMVFAKKHGIKNNFAVDEIGVGGGVVDRLNELVQDTIGMVIPVSASERLSGSGYYNRRAEIYDLGARMFEEGLVQIDPEDEELKEQLSWARYKQVRSSGLYLVEPKEDIKKRYKRSPDNADAFLNGLWALPQIVPEKRKGGYTEGGEKPRLNSETC